MIRHGKRLAGGLLLGLLGLALARPAAADLKDFRLLRAVPADSALTVNARDHEGMAFLKQQMDRVWSAAEKQHFERDLRTLLKAVYTQDGGTDEDFEKQWQQFSDLLLGVEWSKLFDKEFAFAMKIGFPTTEFVMLGLSTPEHAGKNFEGLEAILNTLVGLAPEGELVVSKEGAGDSQVRTLGFANAPINMGSLMLAREKDVLLLGFGQTMPEQTLALLRGEEGQTLAQTERFKAAFQKLPPPTDKLFYMDMARFMGQLRTLIDTYMAMAEPPPTTQEAGLDPKIKALPGKLIDEFDIFEYIAEVSTTQDKQTTADSLALLRDGAEQRLLYQVFFRNGPVAEPLKYIPGEAQNFSVWSGVNLTALYEGILKFIREAVPNGEQLVVQWDEQKLTLPVNIEEDVLSWVGGGFTSFSMPPKSTYQPGPWAMMLSVKDEAKAREVLARLFASIEPSLAEANGSLRDAGIEEAEGFKVIVHPMLAMMGGLSSPTIGVKDGQLFLASSPKAVKLALATAEGRSPNFGANERFQKEGLPVQPNTIAMSFTDLTRLGEELGQILSMVPMIGMFVPELAQNPAGRALISAAGKAGNVVRELNFFQSSCSRTTLDGKVLYTKTLTHYREPPAPEPETPPQTEPARPAEEAKPAAEEGSDQG